MNIRKKILVLYSINEFNDNLLFFCKKGYVYDSNIDYVFIYNLPGNSVYSDLPKGSNVRVLRKIQIGSDFGAWSKGLFEGGNYNNYGYFIFLNSSVRGPFLPVWYDQKYSWPYLFTDKLVGDIKLVTNIIKTISNNNNNNKNTNLFVSCPFATDLHGLGIGIKNGIFDVSFINNPDQSKFKEITYTKAILESGFNIKCFHEAYKNIDFRNKIEVGKIDLTNINPFSILFVRSDSVNPLVLFNYTDWNDVKVKRVRYMGISNIPMNYNVGFNNNIHRRYRKN